MKKLNAYQKIQQAIKDNEKQVLAYAKKYGSVGGGWSHSWRNAIERLEAKGKLKYSKKEYGYIRVIKRKKE